ncbi:hypothetical protein J6590_043958 [Homalodisca vitripennis]|nr:hypothetical protein J6590_043958 [Homalodisca vitripennis]
MGVQFQLQDDNEDLTSEKLDDRKCPGHHCGLRRHPALLVKKYIIPRDSTQTQAQIT